MFPNPDSDIPRSRHHSQLCTWTGGTSRRFSPSASGLRIPRTPTPKAPNPPEHASAKGRQSELIQGEPGKPLFVEIRLTPPWLLFSYPSGHLSAPLIIRAFPSYNIPTVQFIQKLSRDPRTVHHCFTPCFCFAFVCGLNHS